MSNRKCRKDLLQWINAVSFAFSITHLFTPPLPKNGLSSSQKIVP